MPKKIDPKVQGALRAASAGALTAVTVADRGGRGRGP